MKKKISWISVGLVFFIVGVLLGYSLGVSDQKCPDLKCPEIPDCVCPEPQISQIDIPECPKCPDCVCPVISEGTYIVKNNKVKEEVSNEYNKTAYVLQTSRTCKDWLKVQKDKGFVSEEVEETPFCWTKTYKSGTERKRTIARMIPIKDGCKIFYVIGC